MYLDYSNEFTHMHGLTGNRVGLAKERREDPHTTTRQASSVVYWTLCGAHIDRGRLFDLKEPET